VTEAVGSAVQLRLAATLGVFAVRADEVRMSCLNGGGRRTIKIDTRDRRAGKFIRSDRAAELSMKKTHLAVAALTGLMAAMAGQARATTVGINFSGPGVSGALELTYGAATDAKYPNAYEVTGISGTFSDSNNGLNIVNAPVGSLVAITHDTPEPTNLLAPNDFSRFAVASGLPLINNGFLTYTNLFWPGGSPQVASRSWWKLPMAVISGGQITGSSGQIK
jgi:hypothetical protein